VQLASFTECVQAALDSKKISKNLAQEISESADPQRTISDMVATLSKQKRDAALSVIAIDKAYADIRGYDGNTYQALRALMTKDNNAKAGYINVEFLAKYYEAKFHSKLADMLSRFRTRTFGATQDKEGLRNLVKAMYGETVDDAEVVKFAKVLGEVFEDIRTTFNSVGGSISKNQNWKLPPPGHDANAIRKVGLDAWKEQILPMLDRKLMVNDAGLMLTDTELDQALDYVYKTITTHGLHKAKDFTVPNMGTKLSSRGGEKRFLYFKDAESWMKYNDRFGKGDIYTTITDHIDGMSHNIALVQRLGPNPDHTVQALRLMAEKQDELTQTQKTRLTAIWNVVAGKTSSGDLTTLADTMQTTRNVMTSALLGSASLSAITDVAFNAITSKYNSIPVFGTLIRQMSLMAPGSEEARIFAAKIGLLADNMIDHAHAGNRYVDSYGTGKSAKVAEGVIRLSGLAAFTDSGRKAFGMEYASSLADDFGKAFSELSENRIKRFEAIGITEADWDLFRAQTPLDFKGVKFANMLEDGGEKFHRLVMEETDYAVPSPDASIRAATTGGLGRGTATGQLVRAGMAIKTFPLTIMNTHLRRALIQTSGADRLKYTAGLITYTTLLGILAVHAKDLASGREPRPFDAKLVAAGFAQSGGLGLVGDLLFSDVNRFGGGLAQTLVGPYGGLLDQSARLTLGNIHEAIKGEETHVLGEATDFLKRWTPDVWQTRLITDAIADQAALLVDARANDRFRRIVKKRQKDYEQGYWWEPGESPDFLK